ncbi:MAG: hypothetical protein ABWZ85_08305 [Luteibacter sp.]
MRSYARSTLAGLVVVALGLGAVHAQSALSGLGQSWPNAPDVSASPNYHVYVFQRGNTRYIQVNDATGKVRAAVARTPYSLIGTPVGSDAMNVATADEPLPPPASSQGDTVYQDGAVKVVVAPQPDGTLRIMAVSSECQDPKQCTSKGP